MLLLFALKSKYDDVINYTASQERKDTPPSIDLQQQTISNVIGAHYGCLMAQETLAIDVQIANTYLGPEIGAALEEAAKQALKVCKSKRWAMKFVPLIDKQVSKRKRPVGSSWRMD